MSRAGWRSASTSRNTGWCLGEPGLFLCPESGRHTRQRRDAATTEGAMPTDQSQQPTPTEQQGEQSVEPTARDAQGDGEDTAPAALLKALKEEREARREAERKVRKFDQDQRDAETQRAIKAGEWEAVAKSKDTEIADLTARIAALEGQITERDGAIVKAKVAAKYRLPEQLVGRLRGTTEAELDADAKELAKLVAPPQAAETEAARGNGPVVRVNQDELKNGLRSTGRYQI
jgi:hypothetical protein